MATNFPGSLDTSTQQPTIASSDEMDDSGKEHDVVHTNHSGAIIALETKLGTGDSNATANAVLMGTGSGTSEWDTSPTFKGALTVGEDDTGHDVIFYGATGSAKLFWDESADTLYAENSEIKIKKDSGNALFQLRSAHDTESSTGIIEFLKEDGSLASPAAVDDNATLGRLDFYGYDGNSYALGARLRVLVDGTPADGDMPSEMLFQVTPDGGSETPVTALTLKPSGESRFTADKDITNFAPNASSSPTGIVSLYNSDGAVDDFTCLDFIGNGTDPAARIGMKYTGAGSELHFGTSNSYGNGITHDAMKISPTGIVSPVAGAWKSWTPTLGNITIGNGAVIAQYCQFGDIVHWQFRLTFGSTTSFSGSIYMSAPVGPDNSIVYTPSGTTWLRDMGSYIYTGTTLTVGSNIYFYALLETGGSSNGYPRTVNVNASIPHTWGNTDVIYASGWYAVDF